MHVLVVLSLLLAAVTAAPSGDYVQTPVVVEEKHTVIPGGSSTQYHAQSEDGGFVFGYKDPNSQKHEEGNGDYGVVKGSYSYIAPDGTPIVNEYYADDYGFRSSLAPTAPFDVYPEPDYSQPRYAAAYPASNYVSEQLSSYAPQHVAVETAHHVAHTPAVAHQAVQYAQSAPVLAYQPVEHAAAPAIIPVDLAPAVSHQAAGYVSPAHVAVTHHGTAHSVAAPSHSVVHTAHDAPAVAHTAHHEVHHVPAVAHSAHHEVHHAPAVAHTAHHEVHHAPAVAHSSHHGVHHAPAVAHSAHHGIHHAPAVAHSAHHAVHHAPAVAHSAHHEVHHAPTAAHSAHHGVHLAPAVAHAGTHAVHHVAHSPAVSHATHHQSHSTHHTAHSSHHATHSAHHGQAAIPYDVHHGAYAAPIPSPAVAQYASPSAYNRALPDVPSVDNRIPGDHATSASYISPQHATNIVPKSNDPHEYDEALHAARVHKATEARSSRPYETPIESSVTSYSINHVGHPFVRHSARRQYGRGYH